MSLQHPTAFANWLSAADFAIGPVQEIALIGTDEKGGHPFHRALWKTYRPRTITAAAPEPGPTPPLLADRPPLDDEPTAYVCEHFVCQQPVNTLAAFEQQLM